MVSFFLKSTTNKRLRGGFTIIEMLGVTTIVIFITSMVLYSYHNFRNNNEFRNIGYDLLLDIRDAQVRAMTVLETADNPDEFKSGYGIHVTRTESWHYAMYADKDFPANNLRWYDGLAFCDIADALNECFFEKELPTGYSVDDICVTDAVGTRSCGADEVDVSYKRPEPAAHIVTSQGGAQEAMAEIILESPTGEYLTVFVTASGQIYLEE